MEIPQPRTLLSTETPGFTRVWCVKSRLFIDSVRQEAGFGSNFGQMRRILGGVDRPKLHMHCGFSALAGAVISHDCEGVRSSETNKRGGVPMKKFALALALVVAGLSLGGCFVGKGKAPAPIVTKG